MFLQVCPVCEHRNPRGSRFCNDCGSPLQLRFCPACHAAEDVMALECRECGERLPMLVFTDQPALARQIASPSDETAPLIAPEPAPFEPTLGGVPFDLATSEPAPAEEDTEKTIPGVLPAGGVPPIDWSAIDPALSPFKTAPDLTAQTSAQTTPAAGDAAAAAESEPARALAPHLLIETDSEIAVSDEAGTLVEASVAPVVDEPADAGAELIRIEVEEATSSGAKRDKGPLLPGAWDRVIPVENPRLAPAIVRVDPQPQRRLAFGRVGLAAGLVGAIAATLVYVRVSPGPGFARSEQPPTESARVVDALPSTSPAPSNANAARAAAAAAAVPAAAAPMTAAPMTAAPSTLPPPAETAPAPVAAVTGTQDAAPHTTDSTDAPHAAPRNVSAARPATVAVPTPARATGAAVAPSTVRRGAVEVTPVCTASVAALGLCTLTPPQESN